MCGQTGPSAKKSLSSSKKPPYGSPLISRNALPIVTFHLLGAPHAFEKDPGPPRRLEFLGPSPAADPYILTKFAEK